MKKTFLFLFLILSLAVISNIGYAQELCTIEQPCDDPTNTTCIYFFYGDGCLHCARVEPFLSQLKEKYPLEVHNFEIYNNRSNLLILNKYFDSYQIPERERGIPAVFITNSYMIGDKPILDNLEEKI